MQVFPYDPTVGGTQGAIFAGKGHDGSENSLCCIGGGKKHKVSQSGPSAHSNRDVGAGMDCEERRMVGFVGGLHFLCPAPW